MTDLHFLLRLAQNSKKCTFLDNLRTITQEGNTEIRQMTPFFSSTFPALTVCNIHFCFWKIVKTYFHVAPFDPFCSVKFWAKATDLDSPSYFYIILESRHPEVNKNPFYILSPEGEPKKVISSWTNFGRPRKQIHGNTKIS